LQPSTFQQQMIAQALSPRPEVAAVQTQPPLPPAVQPHPGVYAAPVPPPCAPPTQPAVPQATVSAVVPPAQPAQPSQSQPMVSLQVLVPEPGLRPGQKLAFTAPAAGPGMQPTPMQVTVNQEVVPGSIVTVQYPSQQTVPQTQTATQPRLPGTSVVVDPATDRSQAQILWGLYASGCLCMCCITPVGLVLWLVAGAMFFCKPVAQRAQYPQMRTPAYTALITCLVCCILALVSVPVVVHFSHHMHHHHGGPGHHHGDHHHDGPNGSHHDQPWGPPSMAGQYKKHHGCPFAKLKAQLRSMFHGQDAKEQAAKPQPSTNLRQKMAPAMVPAPVPPPTKEQWEKLMSSSALAVKVDLTEVPAGSTKGSGETIVL